MDHFSVERRDICQDIPGTFVQINSRAGWWNPAIQSFIIPLSLKHKID